MESPSPASPTYRMEHSMEGQLLPNQQVSKVSSRRMSITMGTKKSTTEELSKPSKAREISNEINILHKDNEHKERRIQALTKEIQGLRITHNTDQVRCRSFIFVLLTYFFLHERES